MAQQFAVGIDVGGTKILVGVVEVTSGQVVSTSRKRTRPDRGVTFFTDRLLTQVQDALDAAKLPANSAVTGIGIGIAGQVDRERGLLLSGPNIGVAFNNLPLATLLQDRFHLPVTVSNDVDVATIGEQHFGAARGVEDFVCVFIGTGIGGAIVQGGKPYRGATGTAGEAAALRPGRRRRRGGGAPPAWPAGRDRAGRPRRQLRHHRRGAHGGTPRRDGLTSRRCFSATSRARYPPSIHALYWGAREQPA